MKALWNMFSSLGAIYLMYIVLGVMLAFIIYWVIRHLIFGVGKSLRALKRMKSAMDVLNASEKRNYQIVDAEKRCKAISKLWEPFYTCHFCGGQDRVTEFFDVKKVKAVSGYSSAYIVPIIMTLLGVIATVYAKLHYMNGYAYLYVLAITLGLATAVFVAWAIVNSKVNKMVTEFVAAAQGTLATPTIGAELREISNTINALPGIISNAVCNAGAKQQQGGMRPLGKDLEVQIIESIIEACIRKMDDTLGVRFERLNTAIESSTRAQRDVVERIKSLAERE